MGAVNVMQGRDARIQEFNDRKLLERVCQQEFSKFARPEENVGLAPPPVPRTGFWI
jgi:hypothetical protein